MTERECTPTASGDDDDAGGPLTHPEDTTTGWAGSGTGHSLSAAQRAVVSCLAARGGSSSAIPLARAVTARRNDVSAEDVDTSEVRRAYTDLCTRTLPALSRRGVVEYSQDVGRVILRRPPNDR